MIRWEMANLSFDNKKVFDNLNFDVNPGDKILINNKSGSGKTTLLKTALGLITLDSGLIFINNRKVLSSNINQIRRDIFYLDQDVNLPELDVNTLLNEIFSYKENRKKILDRDKLKTLLIEFSLSESIVDKNIKELSGGERQRIGLIIGLLLERPIWLLDEPTSALDKELKELVVNKILSLNITAIVVSHDSCWSRLETKELGGNR
ncbi:ATP-binding cassette domain-containing protein [Thiospirochaeta perfilievii]|uniref:ATP-binding cassette domain-containing protein n=1 Tax=Thiospirochaeta perfilievii TaxID=252967 RepID=A0A5C1QFN9_9SPIO|nr:ATP-binding cassette domain-containing protein [Thiospirochaeta perfilievii]QEN05404.1 ATP-binding cassette domain-containing protein [Thiospirochaeta perfilievii]